MVSKRPQTGVDRSDELTRSLADSKSASVRPSTPELPPAHERQKRRGRAEVMSVTVKSRSESLGTPIRILVAGSDLLAGALASALAACGFATKHVVPREPEFEHGIEWQPNLVLIDIRFLDVTSGSTLIGQLHQVGLPVAVIDGAGDGDRLNAWMEAGTSALIDGNEPFDQLFRTINRLLQTSSQPHAARRSSASLGSIRATERRPGPRLQLFDILTEREQVVLAELMEGHCAEEIANAAFVSISTVRSQIKAILQKLGVNSQLAAVAMARRAGWSLDIPPGNSRNPVGRESRPHPGVA